MNKSPDITLKTKLPDPTKLKAKADKLKASELKTKSKAESKSKELKDELQTELTGLGIKLGIELETGLEAALGVKLKFERTEKPIINIASIGRINDGQRTLLDAISGYIKNLNKLTKNDLEKLGIKDIKSPSIENLKKLTLEQKKRKVESLETRDGGIEIEYETTKRIYNHTTCSGDMEDINNMMIDAAQMDAAIFIISAKEVLSTIEVVPITKSITPASKTAPITNGITSDGKAAPITNGITSDGKAAPITNGITSDGKAAPITNSITSGAPIASSIVSTTKGESIIDQLTRHMILFKQIARPYIIVYLNKCDLVKDEKSLDSVETKIRELLTNNGYPGDKVPIIRGSTLKALSAEDADLGAKSIKKLLETLDSYIPNPKRDIKSPFLMSIKNVFHIKDVGTIASGIIEAGKVKIGDTLEIIGFKDSKKAIVSGVEMFHKTLDEGMAGDTVGLLLKDFSDLSENDLSALQDLLKKPKDSLNNDTKKLQDLFKKSKDSLSMDNSNKLDNLLKKLKDLQKNDVERGMVLSKPGSIKAYKKFKANISLLTKEKGGRVKGLPVKKKISELKTAIVVAEVTASSTPQTGITAGETNNTEHKFNNKEDEAKRFPMQKRISYNDYQPQFFFRTADMTGAIKSNNEAEMVGSKNIKTNNEVKMLVPENNTSIEVALRLPVAISVGLKFVIMDSNIIVGTGAITEIIE